MKTINKIVFSGIVALALAGCSKSEFERPNSYTIENINVDQVFRDHDGYRIYTRKDDGRLIEKKYFDIGTIGMRNQPIPIIDSKDREGFKGLNEGPNSEHVRIYKDLKENKRSFAKIVNYDDVYYVEIHMPTSGTIGAGNETIPQGKTSVNRNMEEVK